MFVTYHHRRPPHLLLSYIIPILRFRLLLLQSFMRLLWPMFCTHLAVSTLQFRSPSTTTLVQKPPQLFPFLCFFKSDLLFVEA